MTRQPNRLPPDALHGFGGSALDRSRPLTFRLNGRSYEAFEGDTVLSALLAAGVDGFGHHFGEPIALDERFSPPVLATGVRDPAAAMPMDRVPVVAGLDLVTVGPWHGWFGPGAALSRAAALINRGARGLNHRLDDAHALEGAWLRLQPTRSIEADTVIVGGGVAGMSAALAAADAGGRVVLVERRLVLGGDAPFFGAAADEEPPEELIARLSARIAATPSINLFLGTEAVELAGSRVRLHQVETRDGRPASRVLAVDGKRIVIATGMAERLPVFAGNRMPGVLGAVAAFHRASSYGVWRGRRALFSTPHSYAYRMALRAADAGIEVQRVADTRTAPQSRYIDFCKASGITLASSLVPRSVELMRGRLPTLSVAFSVAVEDAGGDAAPITTDALVAAGGWQPRIALWLVAGGRCAYNPDQRWIEARGDLDSIVLAGAAAGYRSTRACVQSGTELLKALTTGKPAPQIEDIESGAIYESLDGPTPVAPWRTGRTDSFLDRGATFTRRPAQAGAGPAAMAPAQLRVLSLGDVAAAVELGAIAAADAGIVAQERCVGGGEIVDSGWRPPSRPRPAPPELPAYLRGRFGAKPQQVEIAAEDGRYFEIGCLVFRGSEETDPFAAVGVVIAPAPEGRPGGLALIERGAADAAALFARDAGGSTPAKIVPPPRPARRAAAMRD